MQYFKKMEGRRVYLAPLRAEDAQHYLRWLNDPAVAVPFGHYADMAASEKDLQWLLEPAPGIQRYAIVLQTEDTLIGCASLQNIHPINRNAFIGILIGEAAHRGKGYGAEAIRLLLDYGFHTINLHNIMLSVHADNAAAIACYRKVGFREAGRRREWVFHDGRYVDVLYMDLLEHEFQMEP